MSRRDGAYQVPFEFAELGYEEAVELAADTGRISGNAEPLLETVWDMLDELARPDGHFESIQVAGTNGKTSTSRFCTAILCGEGLRAALYTSPQLVRYEERMEVCGSVVTPELFAHGVSAAVEAGRRVNDRREAAGLERYAITPFDLLTVAAMVVFAEERVDVAVLEVGLGGRWDATSATDPVAVAITGIGLDHIRILGDTLAAIAHEKAAIIKPGRAVVLGEGVHEPSVWEVMGERCAACGVEPFVVDHAVSKLPRFLGDTAEASCQGPYGTHRISVRKPVYQLQNAACAIALAESVLGRALDESALERSLASCPTPGRFETLRAEPLILIDACHNPQSCEHFMAALAEIAPRPEDRPILLIAALSDKDVEGIVDALVPGFARIAVTATGSDRALPASELAGIVRDELRRLGRDESDLVGVFDSVESAIDILTALDEGIVAAGTITLAGEVAALFRG
ncbi:MAG: Mur ligase family protein [Collinsella sp.]|nr:Mur ligase family protein [Collinsella sp.]